MSESVESDPRPKLRADDGRLVRGRRSRDRIQRAARELFRERGFDGATLRAIAERAEMGTSSIYRHVRTKEELLVGELAAANGDYGVATASLRQAVDVEATLTYDEPPPWHAPVRQSLGAVQLALGDPAAAEETYRADLARPPYNGWSLYGLREALRAQGRDAEARAIGLQFEHAWERADVALPASRF